MNVIFSRSDASRVSSGLELLVRLSLGQYDEINAINRMSSFGDGEFSRKMALSDGLSDDIQSWRQAVLGMSPGGYYGIFSPQVSDDVREMMAISKMLREGVVAGYTDVERGKQAPEWVSLDLVGVLMAYDVSCRAKASVFAGTQPSDLPEDTQALVCVDGVIKSEDLSRLEDDAKVFLSLPAVDAAWFHTMAALSYRAYWSLTRKEGYAAIGLSAIDEWIRDDTSEACKRLRENDPGAFLGMIKRTLDQL